MMTEEIKEEIIEETAEAAEEMPDLPEPPKDENGNPCPPPHGQRPHGPRPEGFEPEEIAPEEGEQPAEETTETEVLSV